MSFNYDFDMFSVILDEVRQQFQGQLNDLGMGAITTDQVALFRDPALAEALRSADERIKNLFLDAGFGLNVYHSGAPEGRYPSHDEAARNACMCKLSDTLEAAGNLKGANWGGFDMLAFVDYFVAAEPIDEVEMQAIANVYQASKKKQAMLKLGMMTGGAMIAVSTLGIAIGALGG